jgi:hypothetical protein
MLKAKRILIFQQRGWALQIGHYLAKKLQDEGAVLGALTIKKTTHEFILQQNEVKYDYVVYADDVKEDPAKFLGDDQYSLEQICDDLGIDSIWEIVQAARNHVKTYKDKYYYGFKQNISDEEIITYVKAIYKNIKNIFTEFQPELIITPNFVGIQHILFMYYAMNHNVSMLGVTDSKVRGYYLFVENHLDSKGLLFERFEELQNGAVSENKAKAQEYCAASSKKLATPTDFDCFVNRGELTVAQKIRRYLSLCKAMGRFLLSQSKNRLKNTGVTLDYLPPSYLWRDFTKHNEYTKKANSFDYYPFEKIEKFIYFPLQFQPEAVIDVMAPRFNNQIEVARQIAMSLPVDYTLLVKDHPAMLGYRPTSYLEKIARTPNVKLIDYRIPADQVLRKADMVISPNSTTIAEAAFLKIPAIQLGSLGTTLLLPNVFHHSDLSSLSQKIKEVLTVDLNTDAYDKSLINFVSAVYDVGFDYAYIAAWEEGKTEDIESLWQLYKAEIIRLLGKS